jgi:hypothetical protein
VELDELHVRDAATGAPGGGNAVAGGGVGVGGVQVDLARAAGGQNGVRALKVCTSSVASSSAYRPRHWLAGGAVRQAQLVAGDQVHQGVVLEQRDAWACGARLRSACAARRHRWRRSHARCAARCGRLRASGAAGRLPRKTARPARAARMLSGANAPPQNAWRRGRTRPAPATRVSCTWASKLSSSASTAAMPPCAQALEPSLMAAFGEHATRCVGARCSAADRPAKPLPTIRTSNCCKVWGEVVIQLLLS